MGNDVFIGMDEKDFHRKYTPQSAGLTIVIFREPFKQGQCLLELRSIQGLFKVYSRSIQGLFKVYSRIAGVNAGIVSNRSIASGCRLRSPRRAR